MDFESKIFVKKNAAELLRAEFAKPNYQPVPIAFSGVTDPYQPFERKLQTTRRCLEVFVEFRHPVVVITKSASVLRDLDLLEQLARGGCVCVTLSMTTLDARLQRALEPRASTPQARLEAFCELTARGVPCGVNVSPVIPGLTDHEVPRILEACAAAGVTRAAYAIVRLPLGVKQLFEEWLEREVPLRKERVLNTLRDMHGGRLYDATWGKRLTGEGPRADQIRNFFEMTCRRLNLARGKFEFDLTKFRRPGPEQLDLLGG